MRETIGGGAGILRTRKEQPDLRSSGSATALQRDECRATAAAFRLTGRPSATQSRAHRCAAAKRTGPRRRLCFPRKRRRNSPRYCRVRPRRSREGSWHPRSAGSCWLSCDNPTKAALPQVSTSSSSKERRSVDEKCLRSRISTARGDRLYSSTVLCAAAIRRVSLVRTRLIRQTGEQRLPLSTVEPGRNFFRRSDKSRDAARRSRRRG